MAKSKDKNKKSNRINNNTLNKADENYIDSTALGEDPSENDDIGDTALDEDTSENDDMGDTALDEDTSENDDIGDTTLGEDPSENDDIGDTALNEDMDEDNTNSIKTSKSKNVHTTSPRQKKRQPFIQSYEQSLKAFKCTTCGYVTYINILTREKPYYCDNCGIALRDPNKKPKPKSDDYDF